jgi:DNA topoisomerase-1
LARIVRRCQELPGADLFQYVDEHGAHQIVGSADVNAYLREIAGDDVTAKDFRTWAGTVLAARALREVPAFDSERQAKRNILRAIEGVAAQLGNTSVICRKSYVHPDILDAYLDKASGHARWRRAERRVSPSNRGLRPEESAVVALIERRRRHADRADAA